jgi:N-dimethylarginine dimethylaminohydrolase
MGLCNNVPLNNKKIVIVQGAKKFAGELEKRGYTPVEVPYINAYRTVGSGIHCSVMSLWREYDYTTDGVRD